MEVYEGDFSDQKGLSQSVVMTVGNFDGLHLGHRFLLEELVKEAHGAEKTLALSFSPHPSHVVGRHPCDLLFTDADKVSQFEELGIDHLVIQDFSSGFARNTAEDFLRQYLFPVFQPQLLMLGHDFNFGRGGEGDFSLAKKIGREFDCRVVQADSYRCEGVTVSSSRIRALIKDGDVETAARYLGRPFYIQGMVGAGKAIGRTIGFPTANISHSQIMPGVGVYAGKAEYQGKIYKAVVNVGKRPTIVDGGDTTLECHIIGFDKNIYDETLKFSFLKKIRDEKKFSGKIELMEQISKDVQLAINLLDGSSFIES